MYIASVTPYIPGADGVKILLLEHVNYFASNKILTKNMTGIYNGKYWRTIIVLHSHDYSITVKKIFW